MVGQVMSYTVYVLLSLVAKKSYVGFTDNLKRRIKEHNAGITSFTKRYKPWKVIYMEEFETQFEAREREKYLKSASGRRLVLKKLFDKS